MRSPASATIDRSPPPRKPSTARGHHEITALSGEITFAQDLRFNRVDVSAALALRGIDNIGYGICMASNASASHCVRSIGAPHLGFGICMASGADHNDCARALGAENLGFGICMAGGAESEDCARALGRENLSFGVCMAGGADLIDCGKVLNK
jgi:hypothetical protein